MNTYSASIFFLLLWHILPLSAQTNAGQIDPSFQLSHQPNGKIHTIHTFIDGKIMIGGEFTAVGDVEQAYLARYHPDGQLDTDFTPAIDGIVRDIETTEGHLQIDDPIFFVGGDFRNVNSQRSGGVVMFNLDGSIPNSWSDNKRIHGSVYDIQLTPFQSLLVVGGNFDNYDDEAANNLIILSPPLSNRLPHPQSNLHSKLNADGPVYCIATQNDLLNINFSKHIIIGGDFQIIDGIAVSRIAKLQNFFATSPSITSTGSANGPVKELTIHNKNTNNSVIITALGDFTELNGQPKTGLGSFTLSNGSSIAPEEILIPLTNSSPPATITNGAQNDLLVGHEDGSISHLSFSPTAQSISEWSISSPFQETNDQSGKISAIASGLSVGEIKNSFRYLVITEPASSSAPNLLNRIYGLHGSELPPAPQLSLNTISSTQAHLILNLDPSYFGIHIELSRNNGTTWETIEFPHSSFDTSLTYRASDIVISSLLPNSSYLIRARQENSNGMSPYSTNFSFQTPSISSSSGTSIALPELKGSEFHFSDIHYSQSNDQGDFLLVGRIEFDPNSPFDCSSGFNLGLAVFDQFGRLKYSNCDIYSAAFDQNGKCYFSLSNNTLKRLTPDNTSIDLNFEIIERFPQLSSPHIPSFLFLSDNTFVSITHANNENKLTTYTNDFSVRSSVPTAATSENSFLREILLGPNDIILTPSDNRLDQILADGTLQPFITLDDGEYFISGSRNEPGIQVSPDNKLYAVIQKNPVTFQIKRFEADGTLDSSFAPVFENLAFPRIIPGAFSIQTDKKIIIWGFFTSVNGVNQSSFTRLNPDGSVDLTYQAPYPINGILRTMDSLPDNTLVYSLLEKEANGRLEIKFNTLRGEDTPPSPTMWAKAHGLDHPLSLSDDSDGDGIPYGLEFAYNLNPNSANSFQIFNIQNKTVKITPPVSYDYEMTPMSSTNLTDWTPTTINADFSLQPLQPEEDKAFFLLEVSE